MSSIQNNSRVTIAYEGKLDNGDTFINVTEKQPHTFTLGNQEMPPTVENSLIGLKVGETAKVRVSPEEGYGHRQKILLHTISRKKFSDKIVPKPGMILSLNVEKDGEEHQVPATIMEVSNESVVVDYNHPLAGHHLTYHLKVLHIEKD